MSEILGEWLSKEVKIPVAVGSFESDMASGYYLGAIMNYCHLQPDFDQFVNKRTPDAMINNFSRLQASLATIGIKVDSRMANKIMAEVKGVAARLTYNIKSATDGLDANVVRSKRTGRMAKEIAVETVPSATMMEAQVQKSVRAGYDSRRNVFFEDTVRHTAANPNALMESMHLKKFTAEMIWQSEKAMDDRLQAEQAALNNRDEQRHANLSAMSASRTERARQAMEGSRAHRVNTHRKHTMEREELRVELALAEKALRRREYQNLNATADALGGIASFEENLQRLGTDQGKGDDEAVPVPNHSTPMEHFETIKQRLPDSRSLVQAGSAYMDRMHQNRADEVAARKERDRRRRKVLVEQQRTHARMEARHREESMLRTLQRRSEQERRLAERLFQLRQEKVVMTENRAFRDSQYQARREADLAQSLQRERELSASLREEFEATARVELARWEEAEAARQEAKTAKHLADCREMVWQLVGLSERAGEWRERTDAMVPRKEFREWSTMFVQGVPLLDMELLNEQLKEPEPEPEIATAVDAAMVEDYKDCRSVWALPEGPEGEEPPAPVGHNEAVGAAVVELMLESTPAPPTPPLPDLNYPLKICVVGTPFSGKSIAAAKAAEEFGLALLAPEALISEAVAAADEFDAPPPPPEEGAEGEAPKGEEGAEGEGEGEGEAAKEPSEQVVAGRAAREALVAGEDVPAEVIVRLLVLAVEGIRAKEAEALAAEGLKPEEIEAHTAKGFIVDGFPRTSAHAVLLERALTGVDLDFEASRAAKASLLAPPPAGAIPRSDEGRMVSGLDAAVVLELPSQGESLKRALGRRVDKETGRVYHMEHDPPPDNDPGLVERLEESADDAAHAQVRLAASQEEKSGLDSWLAKFEKLRQPMSAEGTIEETYASLVELINRVLDAKKVAAAARAAADAASKASAWAAEAASSSAAAQTAAEEAARELLVSRKAEVEAKALLNDPKAGADVAATTLLEQKASEEVATHLKAGKDAAELAAKGAFEAAEAAKQAAEAAASAAGMVEGADAAAEARVAAEDAAAAAEAAAASADGARVQAAEALTLASGAVAEAERKAALAADPSYVEPPPAEAPPPPEAPPLVATPVPIERELAELLYPTWEGLESSYFTGLKRTFAYIREERGETLAHFAQCRRDFLERLRRPDNKQGVVSNFQRTFNAVDLDLRRNEDAKAELLLRADELRDALWDICDARHAENVSEREAIVQDSWLPDHRKLSQELFASIAQTEVDKFAATAGVCKDYYLARFGCPLDEEPGPPPPLVLGGAWDDKEGAGLPGVIQGLKEGAALLAGTLQAAWKAGKDLTAAPPADPKAAAAAKGGKDEKEDAEAAAAAAQAAVQAEAAAAATAEALAREVAILHARLGQIAHKASEHLGELDESAARAHARLEEWLRARYHAECSAVRALVDVVKQAVDGEGELPYDLRLEQEDFIVDMDALARPPPVKAPPPPPEEAVPVAGALSCKQLGVVLAAFASAAPKGFISVAEATDLLVRVGGEEGRTGLPSEWVEADPVNVDRAVRLFDPASTGYVDWREVAAALLVQAFPGVVECKEKAFLETRAALLAAAPAGDGRVTRAALLAAEVAIAPEAEEGAFDRGAALKGLLFDLVAEPAGEGGDATASVDALLLYLSLQRGVAEGVARGALAIGGEGCAAVDADQLYQMAYPFGHEDGVPIGRSPVDREGVAAALAAARAEAAAAEEEAEAEAAGGEKEAEEAAAAAAAAEGPMGVAALLATPAGGALAEAVLGRYGLKDPFAALMM